MPTPSTISYAQMADAVGMIARERSEWAGLPLPVEGLEMVIEPRFPYRLDKINKNPDGDIKIINQWFSDKLGARIIVGEQDGIRRAYVEQYNRFEMHLHTMFASAAWPIDAEIKAMEKLQSMVGDHKFQTYLLTGGFIETSLRSKVTYWFRRLKPTVAFRSAQEGLGGGILASLCLHPIGFYSNTWAGVMCPTDDVMAHLCMMRGDEPKFWAHANQHEAYQPQSGI